MPSAYSLEILKMKTNIYVYTLKRLKPNMKDKWRGRSSPLYGVVGMIKVMGKIKK